MGFIEILQKDIELYKDNWSKIQDKIENAEIIGIWGTGLAAQQVYKDLYAMGYMPAFFSDNDQKKWGTLYKNIKVISIDEIPRNSLVIICANVKYQIHQQLQKAGIDNYMYIDPEYFQCLPNEQVRETIDSNADKIEQVYAILSDTESKQVFRNILLHRAVHDLELVWKVYEENQYFGNRIVQHVSGNFVDCGACEGDTLQRFLIQIGVGVNQNYHYYAFEADRDNFEILENYCQSKGLTNVKCYNMGVWDQAQELFFAIGDDFVSGTLLDSDAGKKAIKIDVDAIDHILDGKRIDFISMDIEGSEIKALEGARKSIQKWSPVLAISAYHKLEHLWEIPLLIKEINPKYDIFYAHHRWNMDDTVCYAKES